MNMEERTILEIHLTNAGFIQEEIAPIMGYQDDDMMNDEDVEQIQDFED